MNIVIGTHYFPPHVGGMEIVAKTQATLFAKQGHDVTVITSAVGHESGTSSENGYAAVRIPVWNFFETHMGVPFPFFAPTLVWRSYHAVKHADVVHVHDVFYQTSFILAMWAKLLRKPLVVTQHVGMIPHPNKLVHFVQWLTYRTTGKFVFATSRKILLLNGGVRDFLLQLGIPSTRLQFLPNGVDTAVFRPNPSADIERIRRTHGLPVDKPIALFVGRFVPKKGFHKLLEAASDDYRIALAGGTKPESVAVNDSQVTFLGALDPQTLATVYTAVDMFILPSEGEGFPLTIQEAMATRLPIITTQDPGYAIYELNPKLFVQINPTVPHIKTTLHDLAKNPQLRKAMADYSYTYAKKHFSWDNNSHEMLQLFEDLQ